MNFIEAIPMEDGRKNMGWSVDGGKLSYVHRLYAEQDKCLLLIDTCDVLILGWTGLNSDNPAAIRIKKRLDDGKPVIRVSERIYREGRWKMISPKGLLAKYEEHIKYRNAPVYMLCAGAYVSGDYNLIGAYPGKMYKWGYFPPLRRYDAAQLEDMLYKEKEPLRLCFAARLIKLKHPELAVKAAKYLKDKNVNFHMDIVGDGPMYSRILSMIKDNSLEDKVTLCGFMKPDEVRNIMEKSHVFIFASNYLEGWGAVVNEAMNSACCVIASGEAGAVPYLIKDGINGFVFNACDEKEMYKKLDILISKENREKADGSRDGENKLPEIQRAAYETILNEWNGEVAAKRLLSFCNMIINNEEIIPETKGPMSRAEVIKAPGILRTLREDNHLE